MLRVIFMVLCAALSASCSVSGATASGQGMFALFFNYASNDDLPECGRQGVGRCVIGTLKPAQTIQLLSSKGSGTCLVQAKKSFPSNWDSGSFPLTQIDLSACPDFIFDLAVLTDRQIVYEPIDASRAPSASLAKEIDTQIRQSAQGFKPTSDEHQFSLASAIPEFRQLPSMGSGDYIAIYQNAVTPGDQVHFLYSNGKVQLIHSAATIKSIFGIDGKYFIHYSFTCRVGCGYQGDVIFKFSNDAFEMVMLDDSMSS